jgi:hypothetical protein
MSELSKATVQGAASYPGWDPVPEWDGYPPDDAFDDIERYHSHHHASMQGKITTAALDGDIEAARFEFGGY